MPATVDDQVQIDQLRRMLSGFSHQYRNLLNGIKLSLYLFRRECNGRIPACCNEIERTYHEIEGLFGSLQSIYGPLTMSMVRSPLGQLVAELSPNWRARLQSRGLTLMLDPPERDVAGDFDPLQLGLGLDRLVAWRAETIRSGDQPRLSWRNNDGFFNVCWSECRDEWRCRKQVDTAVPCPRSKTQGHADGLALPLLSRIIACHGGRLERTQDPLLRVSLSWPQFQSPVAGDSLDDGASSRLTFD
jgi:hypothetical protein